MPYPAGTLRFVMKGLIAGVQDWSIGVCATTGPSVAYGYDVLQTFLEANKSAFVAAHNYLAPIRGQFVTFTTLRLEQYTGGDTAFTINEVQPTGQVQGSNQMNHPAYAALCVGLMTNRPGGSYRGRVYIPAPGVGMETTTGTVSASNQTTARTAIATLLSAINDMTISTNPLTAVVASRTTGLSTPILSVRSDQVLDVQRRRQNDFSRNYTTTNVT